MPLDDLTPVVREEQLLSGADLVPETRLEYFLKEAGNAAREIADSLGYKTEPYINLFDPDTVLLGKTIYTQDGSIIDEPLNNTTPMIPVVPGGKYTAIGVYNGLTVGLPVAKVVAYTKNGTVLSNLGAISYTGHTANPNTKTMPANAAYVRMSFGVANYDSFGPPMIVQTTVMPPEFVEYTERSGITKSGKWVGKRWAAVGDSLTERNEKTTINYCDYIADKTAIEVVNMGQSGSGYKRKHDTNNAFYDRVSNVPTDCDVVTIFGSLNDIGAGTLGTVDDTISDDTVFGYVNATIDALYTAYPAVNLGIISPTPWKSSEPWDDTDAASVYAAGLKQICFNRGIPFLDLYHCSNLRPWDSTARDIFYSKDVVEGVNAGCHPDEAGHKMFAPKIEAFLGSLLLS